MNVFKVGSLPWLVRHKLKLIWRQIGHSRAAKVWLALLSVLILAGSFALIISVLPVLPETGQLKDAVDQFRASFVVSPTLLLFIFSLFLLGAVAGGLKLFGSSTDLELLLASPLPNSVVVCSELLGLTIELSVTPFVLLTPVVLLLIVRGIWQVLGGYLAVGSIATIAASLGVTIAYLCIRRLGFRLTRFLVQIFNGSIFFLYIFTTSLIAPSLSYLAAQVPGLKQLLPLFDIIPNLFVRAFFLEPFPTLACVGFACCSLFGATRIISRTIVNTSTPTRDRPQQATRKPNNGDRTFSGSLSWLLLLKEWRLLWRDNTIRASLVLQVFAYIYFIHYFAQLPVENAAIGNVFISGLTIAVGNSLALRFINRMAIAEEAPELLVSCPVPPENVNTSKFLAAWIPAIGLIFPFILLAIWQGIPWMVPFIIAGLSAASTCLIGLWSARGVDNADLFSKGKERRQDAILRLLQSIHYFLWLTIGFASAANGLVAIATVTVAVGCLIPTIALAFARSYQLRKLAHF